MKHIDIEAHAGALGASVSWCAGIFGRNWLAMVLGVHALLSAGFSNPVDSGCAPPPVVLSVRFGDVRPDLKTLSGGEFDWGGTSVKS